MKQIMVIMLTGICCCCGQAKLIAQYLPKSIAPYRIEIGYVKTSNLIFPSAIKSVDRGSSWVLAQKAPGVENILQIKAAQPNFKETNVTVVTADGHFIHLKSIIMTLQLPLIFLLLAIAARKPW